MNWPMIILVVMMVAYIGFIYYANKKRQNEFTSFQSSLHPGMRVYLNDGIYGNIISMSDLTCELEIAENVIITVNRSVIAGIDKGKEPVVTAQPEPEKIEEPVVEQQPEAEEVKTEKKARKAAAKKEK